jgi:hypothetical protein
MNKKQIIIQVSPTGETTIEAVGFKGQSCERATAALEQALGLIKSKRKKPEYYQQQENVQRIRQ